MRLVLPFLAAIFALTAHVSAAAAKVTISIDISEQRMLVTADGSHRYDWPVSTARPGYRTPIGTYHPYRLERMWYSTIYDNAPMPYSIFFLRGYAIHGTTDLAHLGTPVSHGCVRLHPDNARVLFDLVRKAGNENTDIIIRP